MSRFLRLRLPVLRLTLPLLILASCAAGRPATAPVTTGAPSATAAPASRPDAGAAATTPSALAADTSPTPQTTADAATEVPSPTPVPPAADAPPTPTMAADQPAPSRTAGYPGQSNLVPPGYPTPNTAGARLVPSGPPRDPGSLAWAHPGTYIAPTWANFTLHTFAASQHLVTTYYFYWFDMTQRPVTGNGVRDQFDRPPDPANYSFLLPATHLKEFQDMEDAGMDFVLPVYWGEPGHPGRTTAETSPHYWSTEGIPAMVDALDQLHAAGGTLQIGMFYDTTILANADLTTPNGKEYFYVNVRDFYSRIPPKYWAAIDNHPIVWLYDTAWVSRFNQTSLDYLSDRFAQDFGGSRPYIVLEQQWQHSKGVTPPQTLHADGLYVWGAGVSGYNNDPALTVAEVGPGFKNTYYCRGGPAQNCFDVSRDGGAYYEHELQQAVASKHTIMAVETWNEFSEGTDVADTVQYGRQYIDLTRRYADRFKASG